MAGLVDPAARGFDDQHTTGGNVNPLQDYFGTLSPDRQKMLAQDGFSRETWNLPKA